MSPSTLSCRKHSRFFRPAFLTAATLCGGLFYAAAPAFAQATSPASDANMGGMAGMEGHMHLTALRPIEAGDKARADAIVAAARQAMEPYKDYRKALADGYRIFLPNIKQPQYHFTSYANAREAQWRFDPLKPTSLLYKKNPDGSYTLVGAMYTDRLPATENELNQRIPLSVARWHQHVNFCKAPQGEPAGYFGPNAKFGLMGSIHTSQACEAAGGVFIPHVFGWMVHVYPYETDPAKVWSVDDDDKGHDNMDHSAMPGMDMNSMPGMNPQTK
jgi:predicted secreted protein